MSLWLDNLRNLTALVGEKIAVHEAACGQFSHADYTAWSQRRRAADEELKAFFSQEAGAVFTYRAAHDHAVRMAGIRSTSTGGWVAALQNWKRSAEAKIAAGGAEPQTRAPRVRAMEG